MAEALGLQELRAHAMATVGMTKRDMDDPAGHEEKKRALEIALDIDSPVASGIANNLAVDAILDGDLPRADGWYREALRLAERFGDKQSMRFVRANLNWTDFMSGRWSDALEVADALIAECEAGFPHALEFGIRLVRGSMRDAFGDADGALADHLRAVELAREKEDPVQLAGTLSVCAATLADRGSLDEARSLIAEVIQLLRTTGVHGMVGAASPFAERLGVRDELHAAVRDAPPPRVKPWRDALLRALEDDYRGSAEIYAAMGALPLEAEMRFHAGERLVELGSRADGEAELQKALGFYRSVGATHYTRRAETLLAKTA